MKIKFTPTGRRHFLRVIAHIKRENLGAAVRFREKSEMVLRRLMKFPDSGRVLPEFQDLPFREVIVPPYRFFYRAQGSIIWVVAVWHGARLPERPTEE